MRIIGIDGRIAALAAQLMVGVERIHLLEITTLTVAGRIAGRNLTHIVTQAIEAAHLQGQFRRLGIGFLQRSKVLKLGVFHGFFIERCDGSQVVSPDVIRLFLIFLVKCLYQSAHRSTLYRHKFIITTGIIKCNAGIGINNPLHVSRRSISRTTVVKDVAVWSFDGITPEGAGRYQLELARS